METKNYELILLAVPSEYDNELFEFVHKYNCFAMGMGIDLEDSSEEDLEDLMGTILAEGCEKYGLKTE